MTSSIRKLLVANRGEIAVRIIRAAQALGMPTVAACSEADADSLAARMADEVQLIGPARADRSYLNAEALLQAARASGANAIHPGYGFLSENAAFAEAVTAAGLIFVGPQAETIRRMGDKAEARRTAAAAGVPVVPGSPGELEDLENALACAEQVGYPLLIKASAGGGGRGIRIAHDAAELARELPVAQSEAKAAFGSAAVYLERFIRAARHIEVQILGDGQRVVHLFERECSLQRRRQKVFEEAPSPVLTSAQRQALCDSAVRLAEGLGYRGAGTLEYLFDAYSGEFFFIEMNTRIQVEHPVTEMITGVDLVQAMLRIAGGEPLGLQQSDIRIQGAALEMRINAEDPQRNFFPCPGTVTELAWPQGEGIRVESHLYPGYRVPPYYDSLLAKLVVHGQDRAQALARAAQALEQTRLAGMATTMPLHRWLLADARVYAAQFDTGSLERWLAEPMALHIGISPSLRRHDMQTTPIRYSIAGDEHLFAEVSEAMSLEAFFRAMAITRAVEQLALPGILDICLANASFQIRFNPDLIHPLALLEQVKALEAQTRAERRIQTRIIEIPVLYDDPWTNETQARFRDRHQDPSSTDLQYAARINGYADVQAFIAAHSGSPWFVSMVGFVAGLPFMFQMVEQERQLQVPKYLRPRTDTPRLTLGHGGCFGCLYSVRGAGGYQMFGVTPAPIYDPQQGLPYLQESMVFFRAGDIVQFKPIDRIDYDAAIAAVDQGRFDLRIRATGFDLDAFQADPQACIRALKEALHDD